MPSIATRNALPPIGNPLQRFFLTELTHNGLDEVDAAGVARLRAHVGPLGASTRSELTELLTIDAYRAFLTGDGRRALEKLLGLQGSAYGGLSGREVVMPTGSVTRNDLSRVEASQMADTFVKEVRARRDVFQNPGVSAEEKGKMLYLLFQDYTSALNARPRTSALDAARRELLATLHAMPAADVFLLLQDSDGDHFANAYELAFGGAPGRPENAFPRRVEGWSTYQNMHGSFYAVAEKLDRALKAMGRPGGVAEHERRSALAWLMGERSGNTMTGTIAEDRAISSTGGLDFARGLFPSSDLAWSRKVVDGFDIAVDFIDAAGAFVTFDRAAGDRMIARDKATKETLRARSEEVPVEGEPLPRYRPIFERASGEVVPASGVELVIVDARDRVKGDGKSDASHASGWWGFCDRNALNRLVTTRYGYPAPEKDVTLKVGAETFTFTAGEILDIVGRRMTELFAHYDYTGERYDDVMSRIVLQDGTVLRGRMRGGEIDTDRDDVTRSGDMVTLRGSPREDVFGRKIAGVVRRAAGGEGKLSALSLRGTEVEILEEDLLGGFRPTANRPVAWKPSSADLTALADLVIPVAEAQKVGRPRQVPSAEVLAARVGAALELLAASPGADVEEELYRDGDYTSYAVVADWAKTLEKAPAQALRDVDRARLLPELEAFRAAREREADMEHAAYMVAFRGVLARIDEISIERGELYTDFGVEPTELFVFHVAPAPGAQEADGNKLRVGEDQLAFDRLASYAFSPAEGVLDDLRGQVLELAKAIAGRAEVTRTEEEMTLPGPVIAGQRFEVALEDGTQRTVRSREILEVTREDADDVTLEALIAHVKRHGGVVNADSWMNEGVSNGLHVFSAIRDYAADDRDAPDWVAAVKDRPLFGKNGQVNEADRGRVRYYDLGNDVDGYWSSETRGWILFDEHGIPENSGVLQGMVDFLWSVEGEPDWSAPATFNPNVPSDLVLQLYVSSVKDTDALDALARQRLLPERWRDALVS